MYLYLPYPPFLVATMYLNVHIATISDIKQAPKMAIAKIYVI